jgi:hypothetical protein
MPTIARILDIAPVACYLSANFVSRRQLFGGSVDPSNPSKIFNVYKILKEIYDNDPAYDGLQVRCDYLYELCKKFALAAGAIVDGGGGGSVSPVTPGTINVYPFVIDSDDFESDGISYDNPDIVGDNLMIFINEWTQQWLLAPDAFVYTATGIQIVLPGFSANDADYTIVIQKRNNG